MKRHRQTGLDSDEARWVDSLLILGWRLTYFPENATYILKRPPAQDSCCRQ